MTPYKRDVLEEIAEPGSVKGLRSGAAIWAAIEWLQGQGYVTRGPHPRITDKGREALESGDANPGIPLAYRVHTAFRPDNDRAMSDLQRYTDEDLLRELVRRNGVDKAPAYRTMHRHEVLIGIGKDHHCYITFMDKDDVVALMGESHE